MSRYVTFILPDGSEIVIESDDSGTGVTKAGTGEAVKRTRGGGIKAGVGDVTERARETFDQAAENARKAALVILEKVRGLRDSPDEVEITFGLKASGELGSLVVAKAGVEASYSIKLTWKKAEAAASVRPGS